MIPSEAENQSDKLTYDYVESSDGYESGRVSQVVSEIRKSSSTSVISTTTNNYTYDANGNITQITNASGVIQNKYYYDDLNQLTREDNRALNQSYTYTYDNAGNITAKKIYAFTTGTLGSVQETINYTYGDSSWRDLLTNYNGTAITYDTIGNPTQMGDIYLTWQGRQLTQYHDDFYYVTTSYTYNADGIRTSKSVDEFGDVREYVYILNGDTIIGEQVSWIGSPEYSLVYLYDETGSPIGLKYRSDEEGAAYSIGVYDCYFFEKNLQGDIIGIYDRYGTKVVTYTYDAWGNMTVSGSMASTIGTYNPFRYRGYYYDNETGLYHVSSRYYDPEIGRWISPEPNVYAGAFDSGSGLVGYNVYAYCANNPVNFSDPTGEFILTALIVGVVAGAVIGGAIGGTVAYNSAKSSGLEGSDLFWATAGGVGKGALIGGVAGGLVGATGGVIATYGPASMAGTAMITGSATVAARASEVVALQTKKSSSDGKAGYQIANDAIDTVFNNGIKIIGLTPIKKTSSVALNHFLTSNVEKIFDGHQSLPDTLGAPTGKTIPYLSAACAWGDTAYSIVCKDPISRARQRGYVLK